MCTLKKRDPKDRAVLRCNLEIFLEVDPNKPGRRTPFTCCIAFPYDTGDYRPGFVDTVRNFCSRACSIARGSNRGRDLPFAVDGYHHHVAGQRRHAGAFP